MSWRSLTVLVLLFPSLLQGCAARYSVRSEQLAGRDLSAPVKLALYDETIVRTVVSVETGQGVLSPSAIATSKSERGARWLLETTDEHVVGIGIGSLLGLLLGLASGVALATVGCQAGGDLCGLLIPAGGVAGTLAGLGIGAAISNLPVEADAL